MCFPSSSSTQNLCYETPNVYRISLSSQPAPAKSEDHCGPEKNANDVRFTSFYILHIAKWSKQEDEHMGLYKKPDRTHEPECSHFM